jgi:hypothetical protein
MKYGEYQTCNPLPDATSWDDVPSGFVQVIAVDIFTPNILAAFAAIFCDLVLKARKVLSLNNSGLSICPDSETPNNLSSSQFFLHVSLKNLKSVKVL